MITEFIKYKNEIDIPEIKKLCDLAVKVEISKRRVQRSIDRGFLYIKDFERMQSLFERFIYLLLASLRGLCPAGTNIEPLKKDFEKVLSFSEYDKRRLIDELRVQPTNFPMVNLYILRVDNILHSFFLDVLEGMRKVKRRALAKEFVLGVYKRRGIKPGPEVLKGFMRREEGESGV